MRPFLPLLLAFLAPLARAGEEEARALVRALWETHDDAERSVLRERIFAENPDPRRVAAWLAEGRAYQGEPETGWIEKRVRCTDGKQRPYLLYVPDGYAHDTPHRLVIDMHGGVSRPQLLTYAELEQMKFFWGEHAEANGYLLALPTGEKGAEWWTEVGAQGVLSIVRDTRRLYRVDENLVFATGFSDGGSGCFYLALAHPTPFAGFVPLNGHVAVAGVAGFQVHLRNLVNKPLYVVNTENDSLYPSAAVRPVIAALEELKAPVIWRDIPEYTHNPMYLPQERPAIWEWLQRVRREPHPRRLVWEGTATAPSRVHWLKVTRLVEGDDTTGFEDLNPAIAPQRVLLGITVEQEFAGPGVKVASVSEGSPAEQVGLAPGDVLSGLDDAEIDGLQALRAALSRKQPGDAFRLRWRRDDQAIEKEGAFPAAEPRPVFRRGQPYGSVAAEVEGQRIVLRTRGIAALELHLSDHLLDLAQPFEVVVDGRTVHSGTVEPDLAFLLARFDEDEDPSMLYLARLALEVPSLSGEKRNG